MSRVPRTGIGHEDMIWLHQTVVWIFALVPPRRRAGKWKSARPPLGEERPRRSRFMMTGLSPRVIRSRIDLFVSTHARPPVGLTAGATAELRARWCPTSTPCRICSAEYW